MQRTRWAAIVATGALVMTLAGAITRTAMAHECTVASDPATCDPADVYPNWRDNYVPAFDLTDRDDEQQRRDAQRWRDENRCHAQFCQWADHSTSVDDPEGPATAHAGIAGDHSLTEGAHSDEGHDATQFGNHDTHGGSIYVDLCAGSDAGTSMDGEAGACTGPTDTQVGITVVDHLTCPAGCLDEYHVVRPLDQAYTEEQLADSERDVTEIGTDPMRYACGYEEQGSSCYDAEAAPHEH